jgi:hypothetical protein
LLIFVAQVHDYVVLRRDLQPVKKFIISVRNSNSR